VQTDATRTCELLVGLRDVTVLGVDERLRQPLEVCVDPQHLGSIALSRSQRVPVPLFDAVASKWGMPPKCRSAAVNCHEHRAPWRTLPVPYIDPHRDILTQLSRIGAWRASRAWSTCFMVLNRCTDNRKLPSRYAASIPLSAS